MPLIGAPRWRFVAIAVVASVSAPGSFCIPATSRAAQGGPATKEYAVPLDTARHNGGSGSSNPSHGGSSGAHGAGSSGGSDPIFGVGISGHRAASSRSDHKRSSGSSSHSRRPSSSSASEADIGGVRPPTAARDAGRVDSGASTLALTAGIVGGVLLVGLAGGLLTRRLARTSPG
jgi:hypothetical protein